MASQRKRLAGVGALALAAAIVVPTSGAVAGPPAAGGNPNLVTVQLLSFNDYHGHLEAVDSPLALGLDPSQTKVGGALSGVWLGLLVGRILSLFVSGVNPAGLVISTMLYGAVFGAVWAAFGYALTRGRRDFTSVSQVVPSRFELLCEHKVAQQAREILTKAGLIGVTQVSPPVTPGS